MTITGGSAIPQEDIERMVREAEEHAEEDKKRREVADKRNVAENMAYQTDKLIKDNDDKLPEDVKKEVQADVDELKEALKGDDDAAVEKALEKLQTSQTKLGEALYAQQPADGATGADAAGAGAADSANADDDVVDAEVIDEDEENK